MWVSVGGQPQNVTDLIISEGLVEVRQAGMRQSELGMRRDGRWEGDLNVVPSSSSHLQILGCTVTIATGNELAFHV